MSRILSFDTSNYTTSACLFDTKEGIIWENRIMLPVTSGKCGLRQSEAVFLHNRNLCELFDQIPKSKIDFVAASRCPSERIDSYMPCFIVGHSFADSISKILHVPLYTCSHQKNHIGAAIYSADCSEILNGEFFAFHISGGTTDLLYCTTYDKQISVSKAGGTLDISCGQLIDRAGVSLGFPFPCGKYLEENSSRQLRGNIKMSFKKFDYNFSGFENKIKDMASSGFSKTEVCDYTLDIVYSFVRHAIDNLRHLYKDLPVVLTGGVMSNKIISSLIKEEFDNVYFAQHNHSVDNAIGCAYMLAYERGLLNE